MCACTALTPLGELSSGTGAGGRLAPPSTRGCWPSTPSPPPPRPSPAAAVAARSPQLATYCPPCRSSWPPPVVDVGRGSREKTTSAAKRYGGRLRGVRMVFRVLAAYVECHDTHAPGLSFVFALTFLTEPQQAVACIHQMQKHDTAANTKKISHRKYAPSPQPC